MSKKLLVVVDYQNDFVTGSLATVGSERFLPEIESLVKEYIDNGNPVIFTKDTHGDDYLTTQEGQKLPVPHCKRWTEGWELFGGLEKYLDNPFVLLIEKNTFPVSAQEIPYIPNLEEITMVGLVTNICVISNAIMFKSEYPEAEINVIASLCDGPDKEMHNKALDVMESFQINVIR